MPQVTMPQLGEGVEEGTIGKWLKDVGDHVRVGDPLVEVVTDKVNAEVPSPFEGTLTRILVAEGDTVANDAAIAEVDEAGAADSVGAAVPQSDGKGETVVAQPVPEASVAPPAAEAEAAGPAPEIVVAPAPPAPVPAPAALPATPLVVPASIRMTPAVRRLARERGVDVTAIGGSGKGGRITREDVERAAAAPAVGTAPASANPTPAARVAAELADSPVKHGDSLKQLSPMRKAIAAQMDRSLEVPVAYITIEVDMTAVVQARSCRQRRLQGP